MTAQVAIHALALGGTIAMTQPDGEGGVTPSLTGQALVDAVPALETVAAVSAESFRQLPGAHLRLTDIIALRDHLARVSGLSVSVSGEVGVRWAVGCRSDLRVRG